MGKRGTKRKFNPNIPKHINQKALPDKCYWDASGYWYTKYEKENGKLGRRKLADKTAKLSELHDAIEKQNSVQSNCFRYIANEYTEKSNFHSLAKKTKRDYEICFDQIKQYITKAGVSLSDIPLEEFTSHLVQRYIDTMIDTPVKAKHVHAFIRRVFSWAKNRGYCSTNPAIGTELPAVISKTSVPTQAAYDRLLSHAKAHATYGQKFKGSCAHYIWPIMEINYLCYLRGIETRTLNDSDLKENVLIANRKKGSDTNQIEYNERLLEAINYLKECRAKIWEKNATTLPIKPQDRPLVVNTLGESLKESAYHSAWQRFITAAVNSGVITKEQRFSLHDLKHKGCTDSDEENPAAHKDLRMASLYNHKIKTVKAASD